MTPYLQRLYDAAGGTATAVEARPAQRSSSPLLAVDQRLASPAYAASFLLALPGPADAEVAPAPEPALTLPGPVRQDTGRAHDGGPARVPGPRHVSPATRPTQEGAVARPSPVVAPEPTSQHRPTPQEPVADATPAVRVPAPAPAAAPTAPPVDLWTGPVVERAVGPHPSPIPPAEPTQVRHVVEPARPLEPGRLRAVPETAPRPEPERALPESATAPPLVHPAPPKVAEPLPPPAARMAEPGDLAVQVRRLVGEAMSGENDSRRTSRDQKEGSVAEPATAASQARTAEAVSVIGPLDRPPRATTLYGLRLR